MRKAAAMFSVSLALLFGTLCPVTNGRAGDLPSATYDDLHCAAGYTLAAFAVQASDLSATSYFLERAAAAGRRYLQVHPGETQQSYTDQVIAHAHDLQKQLAMRALTPESFVNDVRRCEDTSDSLIVL